MLNTSSKHVIKLTVVGLIIFLSLLLIMNIKKPLPVVQVEANEITFDTPEKLDAAADLIMIASPSKDFMDREHKVTFFDDGTIEDYYTLTEVQVEKIIKATNNFNLPKNNTFSIIEPVGIVERSIGKRKLVTNNYVELKQKSSYIMFLQQNSMGQYGIININLGKFNLDNKDPLDIGEKNHQRLRSLKMIFSKNILSTR
ncbi:hypothetical protein LAV72_06965 [Lysinibacillus xylanilyticus]|uniref:hypothetical protein n=1 Tax=Lysinibacillus xylanilyticus TaxID=582475 RepID=UPI002B2522AE|nr:hypothetical protein [Lysinibacillus xylanilyticus]MEB2299363.1 hypothetical protein [Lysinibacillus xylanilyticus]